MQPSRMIETRHGPVALHEAGPDTGQPVLLIHGNSSCSQVFVHQLESDLAKDYRLLAFDLPGHGASPPAADPERSCSM
ncbi:MAG: alpha/beta fold hydrolase, partial [Rhodospirillales bacterium]|nr:alpha/beta fold hydrolase [Rhodospirillales bacterium]